MPPGVDYEGALYHAGYRCIAGIDEAGRGCWAGPVVAAAVVFSPRLLAQPEALAGVDDSKLLTAAARDITYEQIHRLAVGVGVGIVAAPIIDSVGIIQATRTAMIVALLSLPLAADALLIDALSLGALTIYQQPLIKGDSLCLSIAAASVVAKVTRDRLMQAADTCYPGYGFARHKGYGTAAHHSALKVLGPCALHRLSFRPVAALASP
jgi:ribonuclease HII